MVKGYIYRHWIINDKGIEKSYIGQTINELEIRWQNGLGYTTIDSKFSKAIKKYGWNNFHHDIVETVECGTKEELKDVLNTLEKTYIETYDSFYNGYNSTTGGDSYIMSDEAKNKITDAVRQDVVCLNTGEVFHGILLAYHWATGKYDDKNISGICRCCKGEPDYKTRYKHPETGEKLVWRYKEDYDKMTKEEIETLLNEVNPTREITDSFNELNENVSYTQNMFEKSLNEKLEPVYKILSPVQTYVFNEYFLNGDTMEVIAKRHNVTTTRIGNVTKKIIAKITNTYSVNEFYKLLEIK